MHVGIVLEEMLEGVFGLVEAARVNQVDDDVRRLVEAVTVGTDRGGWREAFVGLARERRRAQCTS